MIMLIGREYEISVFDNLRKKGKLSGCFLLFGDKGVGKFSFAENIVKSLENGAETLTECLVVRPEEKGSIGIDAIRDMKAFLSLRPANSVVRSVIVDDADKLTDAAANAALKIVEEPPEDSLIMMIARDPDNLPATLVSRFKKIYFPPVPADLIASWLENEHGVEKEEAAIVAATSFGRPEFALEIIASSRKKKKAKVDLKFDSDEEYEAFMRKLTASLYNDRDKDLSELKELCHRTAAMGELNTNKKLQIQTIKWTR